MPCNDAEVNVKATIETKVQMTDKESLKLALYDLSNQHSDFTYEETANGYRITSAGVNITLEWTGEKYTSTGNLRNGVAVTNQIVRRYQAVTVQNVLIDRGYLTESTFTADQRIQLVARRM